MVYVLSGFSHRSHPTFDLLVLKRSKVAVL